MIRQIPLFYRAIRREHDQVAKLVDALNVDLIISDNRYGCWSESIPSVLITHQLTIRPPKGFTWVAPLINGVNHRLINRFDFCWIPDMHGADSLAGSLSSFSSDAIRIPVRYIGHLSRFLPVGDRLIEYDVACVLSGPEPQRSLLERIVLDQLRASTLKYIVIGGLPDADESVSADGYVSFAESRTLQELLASARCVIARSGYSTIMDLAAMGKKAILVPTPGQPEQAYLAERLMSLGICLSVEQEEFDLLRALEQSREYVGFKEGRAWYQGVSTHIQEILRETDARKIKSKV